MSESGPEGSSDFKNAVETLFLKLSDQRNVAKFVKKFLDLQLNEQQFSSDDHDARDKIQRMQEAFEEALRNLSDDQIPTAVMLWNEQIDQYLQGIEDFEKLEVPAIIEQTDELMAPTADIPTIMTKQVSPESEPSDQPEPLKQPPPQTFGFSASVTQSQQPQDSASLEIGDLQPRPNPQVQTQGLKLGVLHLTPEQMEQYQQNFIHHENSFELQLANVMKQASDNPGKGLSAIDAMVKTSQVCLIGAKQALVVLQLKQRENPEIPIEGMHIAEQNYIIALKASQYVQHLQAINHAKSQLSPEQVQQLMSERFNEVDEALTENLQALKQALTEVTIKQNKGQIPYSSEQIGHLEKAKKRTFTAEVDPSGQHVSGRVYFNNKDLIHPTKKNIKEGAKAYTAMKENVHNLLTVSIIQAGKGRESNPFELSSKPPPSHELMVQAVIDLKERAMAQGVDICLKDKDGNIVKLTPNPTLSEAEKNYFDHMAQQKSYTLDEGTKHESINTAGQNVFRHALGADDFRLDAKPSDQWQKHVQSNSNDLVQAFSAQVDTTLSQAEPKPSLVDKPSKRK